MFVLSLSRALNGKSIFFFYTEFQMIYGTCIQT